MADKFVKFAQDLIESKDTNLGAGLRQTGDNVKEAQIAAKSRQKAQKAKNTQSLIQGTTSIIGALAKIELEQRQLDVTLDGDRKHNEYFQGLKNLTPAEKVSSIKNLMENNTVYEGFKEDLKKANIPDYVARGLLKAYGTRQRAAVTKVLSKAVPQVNAEKKKVLKQVTSNVAVDVEANPNQDYWKLNSVIDGSAKLFALTGNGKAALNTIKSTALDAQIRGLINQGSLDKASTLLTDIENRKRIGIKQARKLDGLLGKAEKEGRNQIGVQVDLFKEALKTTHNFSGQVASMVTSHETKPLVLDAATAALHIIDKLGKGTFSPEQDTKTAMKKLEGLRGKIPDKKFFSLQNDLSRFIEKARKKASEDYVAFKIEYTGERPTGAVTVTKPEIKDISDRLEDVGSGRLGAETVKNLVPGIKDRNVLRQVYFLKQGEGSKKAQNLRTLGLTKLLNSDNIHVNEIKDYMDNPDNAKNGIRGVNLISSYETRSGQQEYLDMSDGEFVKAAERFGSSSMFMTVVGVKTAINVQKDLPVEAGEDVKLYALRYRAAFNKEAQVVARDLYNESVTRTVAPQEALGSTFVNDVVSGVTSLVNLLPLPEDEKTKVSDKVTMVDSSWLSSFAQGQIGNKQVMIDKNGSELKYYVNDEQADGTTIKRYLQNSKGEDMTVSLSKLTHLASQQFVTAAAALSMSANTDNLYAYAPAILTGSKTAIEKHFNSFDSTELDAMGAGFHIKESIGNLPKGAWGTDKNNFQSKEEKTIFSKSLVVAFMGAETGVQNISQIPTRGDKTAGVGLTQFNPQEVLKGLSPDAKIVAMKAMEKDHAFIATVTNGIANDNAKVAHNRLLAAAKDIGVKGDINRLTNGDVTILRTFLYNGGSRLFSGPEFVKDWAIAKRDKNHVIQVRKTKLKGKLSYQPMKATAEQLGHAIKVLNYASSDDLKNRPNVNTILEAKFSVYNPSTGNKETLTGKQVIIKARGQTYFNNLFSTKTHSRVKSLLGDNAQQMKEILGRNYWQKQ